MSILVTDISKCESIDGLIAAEKHIVAATNACKIPHTPANSHEANVPSNKKIIPQMPFTSTKRKHRKPTVRLAKPSRKEKEEIYSGLQRQSLYSQGTEKNEQMKSNISCTTS